MSYIEKTGVEFLVNSTTSGPQEDVEVAALADGGFVAIWVRPYLRGQVFDADGNASGSEFQIAGTSEWSYVSGLEGGGFVVAWSDTSQTGADTSGKAVRVQIYDGDGATVGSNILVNTTTAGNQTVSNVTGLTDGGFIVGWVDSSGSPANVIRAQRFAADGTQEDGEFVVTTSSPSGATTGQAMVEFAALPGGGFAAVWIDASASGGDNSGLAVRGRLYDSDGNTVGSEFLVNSTTAGNQTKPSIATLADGGFVVVWDDDSETGGDTDGRAIRGQVFAADGSTSGSEFLVNNTTAGGQGTPVVTALDTGDFVVTWNDESATGADTSLGATRGRLFASDGTPKGADFVVNTTTDNHQINATATALPNGRFVVTWEDFSATGGDTSSLAIRGQVFTTINPIVGSAAGETLSGTIGSDAITGLLGDDVLSGGAGDDSLSGGSGGDTLFGGAGVDVLHGHGGADLLAGGDDVDYLAGWDGADTLSGSAGDDTLDGGLDDDLILGGDGADLILGVDGSDVLQGGLGADTLFGFTENDSLSGGAGNDRLFGEAGDDLLHGHAGDDLADGGAGNDYVAGWGGDDSLSGGAGNDTLDGGLDDDRIAGGSGDDLGFGSDGDDRLDGNAGNDTLFGNDGQDSLHGQAGADILLGEAGNDYIAGWDGNDTLSGAAGADILDGGTESDRLHGGDGDDQLFGVTGADTLIGGQGNDLIFAGGGDDRIEFTSGQDTVFGDAGEDLLVIARDLSALSAATVGSSNIVLEFGSDRVVLDESVETIEFQDGSHGYQQLADLLL